MKEFFSKLWVKIVAWCMVVLGSVVLIIGGVSADEIGKGVLLVSGVISAIGILIAFISSMVKAKK